MSEEEFIIIEFLKGRAGTWSARREIARRAVKRQVFEATPHWPDIALASLVARGQVEMKDGHYRLKPDEFVS